MADTMRLVVPVNQRECLRRGIAAPSSTVTIEIDPAALVAPVREVLAASLAKGHLLEVLRPPGGSRQYDFAICPPNQEGLIAAVLSVLSREREVWTDRAVQALERSRRVERCQAMETEGGDTSTVVYEVPALPRFGSWGTDPFPAEARQHVDAEVLARLDARDAEVVEIRAAAEATARAQARAQLPAVRAARLEREAKEAAAREAKDAKERQVAEGTQALVASFPDSARERALAGVLPRKERDRCMADAIVAVACMDLPDAVRRCVVSHLVTPGWDHLREITTFDAPTWEVVREVRRLCAVTPSRFVLEDVVEVWDDGEEEEEEEEEEEVPNRRTIVRVQVTAHHNSTRAEIEVTDASRAAFASEEWEAWIASHTPGER